jgi:diguanylate cyclase (GGDEF)-like protein/PAS domain S-box-containing protein
MKHRFPVRLYQAAVSIAAMVSFAVALDHDPGVLLDPVYLAWVAALAAVSLLPVPATRARVGMDFPLSMALAVLYPPAAAGAVTFVGSCDTREFKRQIPPLRALFNRSQVALATVAASSAFHAIAGTRPDLLRFTIAAIVAVVIAYAMNITLVSIAMSLDFGMSPGRVAAGLRIGSLPKFVGTFIGLGLVGALLAWLYERVGAWTVVPWAIAVLLGRRMYLRTRELEDTAKRLERSLAQLTLLQDFASKLDRLRDVARIGETITEGLLELVDYEDCRVYQLDASGTVLEPIAYRGKARDVDGSLGRALQVNLGEGITGRAVTEDRTVYAPNAATCDFAVDIPGTPDEDESIVAVPMRAGGRALGAIALVARGLDRFDPSDIRVLEVLASRAGVAIDNARLLQLQRSIAERYRVLVERLPAITYIQDLNGRMGYVSPQIQGITGFTAHERIDDPESWWSSIEFPSRQEIQDLRSRRLADGSPFLQEFRLRRADGRRVWLRDEAVLVRGRGGGETVWQGVMVDVTARRAAESRIEFLAFHDTLTELPNRALFEQLLAQSLERARRNGTGVAVLSLDVDGLKLVNDALGHDAGDELLRRTADSLRSSIRKADMAARVGGDEFAVLAPDLPLSGDPAQALAAAERVALRVQESLRRPLNLQRRQIYASTSIGISVFPVDADDAASLIRNADAAMYQAKRTEPGSYVVFSGRAGTMRETLALTNRLRRAAREHRWALEYQPIIDLERGAIVAAEALLRLPQGRSRVVPAVEFIQMAEEMGLMGPVTEWVMATVCRQILSWRRAGVRFGVTFNLSARQLWDPSLPDMVLRQLDGAGIDPSVVTAEVTESAVMTQDHAPMVLRTLHDAGIRIAIDDFGTGYSSLSRLRELPVDVVKIDRSFIRDLPDDGDARTIVRAMIQLVRSLEIVPLAEGIETDPQLEFLSDQGCELGQGFLFARPMAPERLLEFAQTREKAV